MQSLFTWIVAAVLGLGAFPSLTALSNGLSRYFPILIRYTGPINPLKVFLPLLAIYLWVNRHANPARLIALLAISLGIGTLATYLAGLPCGLPVRLLRE